MQFVGLPEASVTGEDDVYLDLACLLPGLYQFGVASQGPGGYYMLLFKCTECACGTTSLPNFDLEQNNNLCGPNNPALASGDSLWGAITNLADVDWFNFEVTEQSGETVSVSLIADGHPGFFTYGQGLNPKLFLFGNQCQSMIANDDDSGLGADAFLGPIFLPQGFYSIKVEGNGSVGPYILGTRCESCPCETCPHPNRDNEANNGSCGLDNPVVSCGQTFCGEILNPNDLDYYTFIPPQDACTWFTIRVLADDTPDQCAFGGGLDAAIDVYSANCGGPLQRRLRRRGYRSNRNLLPRVSRIRLHDRRTRHCELQRPLHTGSEWSTGGVFGSLHRRTAAGRPVRIRVLWDVVRGQRLRRRVLLSLFHPVRRILLRLLRCERGIH
ncbi:MAG: hypothetical protein IPH10_14110 [bacterium]|nr:hypothetical protein [bacterium]